MRPGQKLREIWKLAAASAVLVTAAMSLSAAPASAVEYRGVDMNAACKKQHGSAYTAHVANTRDVYSWYCHAQHKTSRGLDVARACRDQHGWGWRTNFRDRYDAFSWYCYK